MTLSLELEGPSNRPQPGAEGPPPAEGQRIASESAAKVKPSGSITTCFGPASTRPAAKQREAGARRDLQRLLSRYGRQEQRVACAHVERAVRFLHAHPARLHQEAVDRVRLWHVLDDVADDSGSRA